MPIFRNRMQAFFWSRFMDQCQCLPEDQLAHSAVVFSPHQDDETLGCGGTLLRKIAAGAQVSLVFMTDGRSSHSHLVSENELVVMRRQEATAAGEALGIPQANIHFLEHFDGQLGASQEQALQQVTHLLQKLRPQEVFIPYAQEPPPDHAVTTHVVLAALENLRQSAIVNEYPVWFWFHWPWVSFPQQRARESRTVFKNSLQFRGGWSLASEFRTAVYIGDMLQAKYNILQQHRSQMERINDDPRWLILGDISEGQFLDCFFRDYEIFKRYQFQPDASLDTG